MTMKPFKSFTPAIGHRVFMDDTALIIGRVTLAEDVSIWPMAVLRGDVNSIDIGERTNIQDGSVIHVNHEGEQRTGSKVIVEHDVTVGHRCVLHGCIIKHHCLIGINSVVMDDAVIEPYVLLAAGSLVPPGKHLESGLWCGSPARKVRDLTEQERTFMDYSARHYVKLKDEYL